MPELRASLAAARTSRLRTPGLPTVGGCLPRAMVLNGVFAMVVRPEPPAGETSYGGTSIVVVSDIVHFPCPMMFTNLANMIFERVEIRYLFFVFVYTYKFIHVYT